MRNAAVFFCYKELTDVELSAFKYSLLNLRDSFEIFCITKSNLYSYVTKILYKDFYKVYIFDNHLSSLKKYTRYLKSSEFYELFEEFDYLQIWQDDAVVLRPMKQMDAYSHISYVGAPINNIINKEPYTYVGNGGLSLRKVQDHLTVLRSKLQIKEPKWYTRSSVKNRLIFEIYKQLPIVRRTLVNYNEDFFWTCINNHPVYQVASIKLAMDYAWETNLATQNLVDAQVLPFGCHAWEKFARPENKTFILDLIM